MATTTPERRPVWLKVRPPQGENYEHLKQLMRSNALHTVCEEARCPNIGECWGQKTATFMILGRVWAKELNPAAPTKSGFMLGLGETWDEVIEVMRDLRQHDVDLLTIGQYLRPSMRHLPIERYITLEEFAAFKVEGQKMGYRHVESGPLVRSSYHARSQTNEDEGPA